MYWHLCRIYVLNVNIKFQIKKQKLEYVKIATVQESLSLALIESGKQSQNGLNESFNGKFRDKSLSMEWFRCRSEARVVIQEWRRR